MSKTHFFNVDIATDFSVNQSIVLTSLMWWYEKAQSHQENQHNGKYWVRMSAPAMAKVKKYFSVRQIRNAIAQLVDNDLLIEDAFNAQSNDHTKWYTPTDLAKKYYGLDVEKRGDKIVTPRGDKIVTQGDKIVTSIYKEVDIDSIYIQQHKKLSENHQLLEIVAMHNKLKLETVKKAVSDFILNAQALGKEWNNDLDLQSHFQYWVPKQNYSDVNLETEINWFIDKFNNSFKTEFVVTDTMRKRFARQLQFGFTGRQMLKAAANMRSSNPKNKFHIENQFKFATPEYLLKDDNVNKYLNVKL